MSEMIESKKYFIKDEELTSLEADKFSSKDIAKNIEMIIDNTKPPFAMAITGKSGIGKSSIINFVAENYSKDSENYNVQKINVWKQEKTLKDILDSDYESMLQNEKRLKEERDYLIDSITEQADSNNENNTSVESKHEEDTTKSRKNPFIKVVSKIAKAIFTILICFLITAIVFVIMEYLSNKDIYKANDIFFVENIYIIFKENIIMILIFTFGLSAIAYIINTLRLVNKKSKIENKKVATINNNVNNTEAVANNNDLNKVDNVEKTAVLETKKNILDLNKKNIIIVEDIDKLTASKMLSALEEIKHFNEYENCIFIVSFDEKVLARAIDVRNQVKLSANYRPLKFEKILDKIFQFKIYVPHIQSGSIKDYAVDMVQETIPSFIEEYCSIGELEKVIRNVLVYKNVTTPRHVKKLINNFINNKILISNRVQEGKIEQNIVDSKYFNLELAKISVLQSDFEEFYDMLFKDFDYLPALTQLYCLEQSELANVYDKINDDLKPYFSNRYRPLMNFLRQTKGINIENMPILMYYTKVKTEKMFKDKTVLSYVIGDEDITELRIQEVLELVKCLESKEDLKEFTANNFGKLLDKYELKASNKIYFETFSEIVDITYDYIDEPSYIRYLEIAANNYSCYPEQALEMFEKVKIEIPVNIMNVLLEKMQENISKENYDKSFEFLRDNSNAFYEEEGNISEYVQFLVNNISLASNPTEVITELDDNFTRIGKVYELNRNIKGLENLDYDVAYKFMAKCLDNGDLDRMVNVINSILSDEDSVESCLNIEEKMSNYTLVDVIECNVDDLMSVTNENQQTEESLEENTNSIENAQLLEGNYTLLKNLIEVCSAKQEYVEPTDAMKIVEKALGNTSDEAYILSVYKVLEKFDRMYFYEIRRDFNEVIYASFHTAKNDIIRKSALDCTRYFKNTRLFKTKLNKNEEKFYEAN